MIHKKTVAIIPARGGSKGIPRKNLRSLAGQPLLVHTIRHAQTARLVQRVIVSTEDDEIATVAQSAGAEVVIRPPELATDSSPSEAALIHVLKSLDEQEQYTPELIVFLQCTSPLRTGENIDNAIDLLIKEKADSLFSACRSHAFIWRLEGNKPNTVSYNYLDRKPRQSIPPMFEENGSIYITRTELLKNTGNRLGGKIMIYEMRWIDSFQIDSEEDLFVVEDLLLCTSTSTS